MGNDLELVLGARSWFSSSYFTALDYLPEMEEGGYVQSDAYITLQSADDKWSVTGFVNNIEDEVV